MHYGANCESSYFTYLPVVQSIKLQLSCLYCVVLDKDNRLHLFFPPLPSPERRASEEERARAGREAVRRQVRVPHRPDLAVRHRVRPDRGPHRQDRQRQDLPEGPGPLAGLHGAEGQPAGGRGMTKRWKILYMGSPQGIDIPIEEFPPFIPHVKTQEPEKKGLSSCPCKKKSVLSNPFLTSKFLRISHKPEYSIRSSIPWSWRKLNSFTFENGFMDNIPLQHQGNIAKLALLEEGRIFCWVYITTNCRVSIGRYQIY